MKLGPTWFSAYWNLVFRHHLLKRFLLPLNCLGTLVKNQLAINIWVYLQTFSSWSIVMLIPYCFDYCCIIISFKARKHESFNFFCFKIILTILCPIWIWESDVQFLQKIPARILIGIALNLSISLRSITILMIASQSVKMRCLLFI